jgi:hypothetical protein
MTRIPPAEPVPDVVELKLRVETLAEGGYSAEVIDDGEVVATGHSQEWGREAAGRAISAATALTRMRPNTVLRGPDVFLLIDERYGWPLGNLHMDGCKHDIFIRDSDRVRAGLPTRCAKCQAVMLAIVHVAGKEPDR